VEALGGVLQQRSGLAPVAPILAHYDYVIFSDNQPFLVREQPCAIACRWR
jgi:hypothetical protein